MALYEYFCQNCKIEFEIMRPMSESDRPASCPKCGAECQKLVSGFGSKTGSYIQSAGKPLRSQRGDEEG